MNRFAMISMVLGSGLTLGGGCSMFSSSDTPSGRGNAARNSGADARDDTNRVTTNTVAANTSNGTATNASGQPLVHGNSNPPDMDRRNDGASRREPTLARTTSWSDESWNDREAVMVNEWEVPTAARMGLVREAGGTTLRETGHGMWNGQKAYCARVSRNGHEYKVITDAQGDLIAMRRLE